MFGAVDHESRVIGPLLDDGDEAPGKARLSLEVVGFAALLRLFRLLSFYFLLGDDAFKTYPLVLVHRAVHAVGIVALQVQLGG